MSLTEKMRRSMAVNVIGAIVILLLLFGVIAGATGVWGFTRAFKKEYAVTTYHMADTAAALVNGDRLEEYLEGGGQEEYEKTKSMLDAYCKKMSVSLIYVILVDRSDYGRFVSVFNSVDNTVDNSSYTAWELGHRRDTTNEEYRLKYRAIYEKTSDHETVYRMKPTDGQHPHVTTMVPVKDSAGDVSAILCVQRPARELADARRPYLIAVAASTAALALAASLILALFIRRHVVDPIRVVSDEATRFARENTVGGKLGELSRYGEISSLARSVDAMEEEMADYIKNLTAATAERERIGAELELASSIQEKSIPNEFPAFPEREEFDIYAVMDPAKEVGGDFYNFFLIDDDHLAMVIGDVSGKGVPAALFMMVTNILLSERAKAGGTPGEILACVNDDICEHNEANMFVTLWLGILEISTGRIVAANAGHDDAAICRSGGAFELYKTAHGLVAGAMPGIKYKDHEIKLSKGDKLFIYTDGLPEATDAEYRMLGLDGMLAALNDNRELDPRGILEGVRGRVEEFVGEAPQFDDLTMLCLELT